MATGLEQLDSDLSRSEAFYLKEKEVIRDVAHRDEEGSIVQTVLGTYSVRSAPASEGNVTCHAFKYLVRDLSGAPESYAVTVSLGDEGYDHFWLASNADPAYALVRFMGDRTVTDPSNPFMTRDELFMRADDYQFQPTSRQDIDDLNDTLLGAVLGPLAA
ncbi:MAG TPA: hypothetical protein VLE51_02495 [Candidatus Saccharimonadales bacterium]|nr:hypothetical protein [Candidatus Saccharimonadales bacterium]